MQPSSKRKKEGKRSKEKRCYIAKDSVHKRRYARYTKSIRVTASPIRGTLSHTIIEAQGTLSCVPFSTARNCIRPLDAQ